MSLDQSSPSAHSLCPVCGGKVRILSSIQSIADPRAQEVSSQCEDCEVISVTIVERPKVPDTKS